jgi:hypothetical protein
VRRFGQVARWGRSRSYSCRPMPAICLPNFFIIGAAKCGTSSLRHYLDQHPEISMSSVKEPNVYSESSYLPRHPDYTGMFDCRAPRRGDASTGYSRYPIEGDAARLIHDAVPEAKLIYLVRDPVERIVSEYVQWLSVGFEERRIDDALRDFDDPSNPFVCASRYAEQLDRYLEFFDRSAVLVIEQSELRDRREEAIRRVFDFLGVDPDFSSAEFRSELFTRDDYVRFRGPGWHLRASPIGKAFRMLPVRLRLPISRGVRRRLRDTPRPTIDPGLERQISEFLRADVNKLESLIGRRFDHWLPREPAGSLA